jgi:hypothetical protein
MIPAIIIAALLLALAVWALVYGGTRTEEAQEPQIGAWLAARRELDGEDVGA